MNPPSLGKCCVCEKEDKTVRNIMMVHRRAPTPGTGWGCVVCGLSPDGAIAVFCDACFDAHEEARFICDGYAVENKRVPYSSCPMEFEHDEPKHEDHEWALRNVR